MRKCLGAFAALVCAAVAILPTSASAQYWQCVGYARQISGVAIHGDAHTWWQQAAGRYERGTTPRRGAVMAFRSSGAMPLGHVAVVAEILSPREVLLDHANWSRGGQIERGVRAVDVSEAGDWSAVKVWFGPIGDMGRRINPVSGFIYPDSIISAPPQIAQQQVRHLTLSSDVIQLASLESTPGL